MFLAPARLLGVVVIAAALLAGCASNTTVTSPSGTTTTLILLRHAERTMLGEDQGMELSDNGLARAAALPAALEGMHIDAIYSPHLSRNLDTVAPLAKQRGLTVKVIGASQVAARLIGENPGKTVLWVGNKDNLDEIYEDVGGEGPPPIVYGDLYIVRVPDKGPAKVTKLRFGR
jgi:hypothetical protein